MSCSNNWITIGALVSGLAVVTGAFAAHGLYDHLSVKFEGETKTVFDEEIPTARKYLGDFKTAAEYQMYHGLALIAVGLLSGTNPPRSLRLAGWSFLGGVILFSGSLYALTLTGATILGAITPIGGLLFIIGWVALAAGTCPCGKAEA